jgi:hypothetical protein
MPLYCCKVFLCFLAGLVCFTCSSGSTHTTDKGLYRYDDNHAYADISVPFYLYSGGEFDIFWNSCKKRIFAKGVEVSFLLHLQNHPWRTQDPEAAALFVIPGLFSVAMNSHNNESNCALSVEEMSTTLASAVGSSPWFLRHQGADHLMVVGYFMAELFLSQSIEWSGLLKQATLGLHSAVRMYIGKRYPRCIISVGHQASPNENSQVEVKSRDDLVHMRPLPQDLLDSQAVNVLSPQPRTFFMLGQANKNRYYRHRVTAVKKLGGVGENSFVAASKCEKGMKFKSCGINRVQFDDAGTKQNKNSMKISPVNNCCLKNKLPYTAFLKQMMMSNFSLLIGGGDPGSSRFADAIALSIPQLILSDGFYSRYAPFPCIVPWRDITEEVTEQTFREQPVQAVEEALSRAGEGGRREHMIRLQQQYARDVDWTHPHSLAANNLLVEAVRRCFPASLAGGENGAVRRIMSRTKKVTCFRS